VLTVQTGVVLATGELWLYLLQFPLANFAMCVVRFRRSLGNRRAGLPTRAYTYPGGRQFAGLARGIVA
jgi:hypothetical protein